MSKKLMIVGEAQVCVRCGNPVGWCGCTDGEMEPNPVVTVVFRWEGGKNGNVVAVMPLIDDGRNMYTCYAHLGQHGSGQRDYFTYKCRPATPEEYAPLLKELTSAPYFYRFRIVQRWPKYGTPMEG
jgi:hypothetical protein